MHLGRKAIGATWAASKTLKVLQRLALAFLPRSQSEHEVNTQALDPACPYISDANHNLLLAADDQPEPYSSIANELVRKADGQTCDHKDDGPAIDPTKTLLEYMRMKACF